MLGIAIIICFTIIALLYAKAILIWRDAMLSKYNTIYKDEK